VTPVVLVSGGDYAKREAAVAAELACLPSDSNPIAVILEGLPQGQQLMKASPTLLVQRIAPGCLCCIGNLALRVTLNRLLRKRPGHLYIALSNADHITQLSDFLSTPDYAALLRIDGELVL
jgi:G3E family GTPase